MEETDDLWIERFKIRIKMTVLFILSQCSDKFGYPTEVTLELFIHFFTNILFAIAIVQHIANHRSSNQRLVDNSFPIAVCLPAHSPK